MPIDEAWEQRWNIRLDKDLKATIWWTKYKYDKRCMNLPPEVVAKFEDELVQAEARATAREAGAPATDSAVGIIDEALGTDPAAFELQCTRHPRAVEPFCCIIDARTFADFYLLPDLGIGLELTEQSREDYVWDRWGTELTSDILDGWLRSSRRFFWFTTARRIDTIRAQAAPGDADRHATNMRDWLGLNGFGLGVRLFLLKIPDDAIPLAALRAPTTFDTSAANTVFAPSNDADGWGWTLYLHKLSRGCEELVAPMISVTPKFDAEKLGRVAEQSPVDVNDEGQLLRLLAVAQGM